MQADSLAIARCSFSFNSNADQHHPFARGQIRKALNLVYSTTRYDPPKRRQDMSKRKSEDDEWKHKAKDIWHLYIVKNHSLDRVMEAMNLQGFRRTYVPLVLAI